MKNEFTNRMDYPPAFLYYFTNVAFMIVVLFMQLLGYGPYDFNLHFTILKSVITMLLSATALISVNATYAAMARFKPLAPLWNPVITLKVFLPSSIILVSILLLFGLVFVAAEAFFLLSSVAIIMKLLINYNLVLGGAFEEPA